MDTFEEQHNLLCTVLLKAQSVHCFYNGAQVNYTNMPQLMPNRKAYDPCDIISNTTLVIIWCYFLVYKRMGLPRDSRGLWAILIIRLTNYEFMQFSCSTTQMLWHTRACHQRVVRNLEILKLASLKKLLDIQIFG